MDFANTYVKIDLDAILENFNAIREKAGVPVMAVVKADAYGHGAVPVAQVLEPVCSFFGVASVPEALQLRQGGIQKPILILGYTPPAAYGQILPQGIRPAIYSYEDGEALSRAAQVLGITAPFHFAVDTGMSRLGFQAGEAEAQLCARIAAMPGLYAEGIFSHFATADEENLTQARLQAQRFEDFCEKLRRLQVDIPIRHLDNSAGIMNFRNHQDMVRAGIVTYGLYPSQSVDPKLLPLRPAMTWHSQVCHVKWLEPGRKVGYGGTYTVTEPIRVATVAVGYADGYRRNLSGKFHVLIRGGKAPILGRVCMDQMIVDVTNIPEVRTGDPVVLMGDDGEESITAEALAEAADSFNYELVSTVGRRCARKYYQGGKCIQVVDYLL